MDIVTRVKGILLTPKTEWVVVEGEQTTVEDIYRNYLVYIAAVPAIAGFIGMSFVGYPKVPIGVGLVYSVLTYILSLASVYALGFVIDKLAPTFDGTPNFMAAFRLAAYSVTVAWLAGIFSIVPRIAILGVAGLYGIYVFYLGLPVLMKAPAQKVVAYAVAAVLCAVVVNILIVALVGMLLNPLL